MSRFRTVGEPGLYVHRDQYELARQIATPPVYIDETLTPDGWYIVTKRPRVPDGPQMSYMPLIMAERLPTKSEIDVLDALLFLTDIVGDLHETGKTSNTRLELLQSAVNRLRLELAGHRKD